MESVIKKNRFSLKNKAGASKFSSITKQSGSNDGYGTICDAKITEKEPNATEKLMKCHLPLIKTSNLFSDWKPLPTIEDIMEVPTKHDKESKLNPANTKSNSNLWIPLPKPCLRCIAQHFLRVELIVQEAGILEERGVEVVRHPSGFMECPQLTSELQELQNQKWTTSPDYLN